MSFSTTLKRLTTAVAVLGLPLAAQAQFTAGRLVVVQANAATGAATVTLNEYQTSGTAGTTVALPTAVAGANKQFRINAGSATEGGLNLSNNGSFLTMGGYDAIAGATLPGTAALINRVIARIAVDGTVNTATALTDAHNSSSIRSVLSNDGTQFYTSGGNEGIRYATLGATTSAVVSISPASNGSVVINLRQLGLYNGAITLTTGAGTVRGTYALPAGFPTTSTSQTPVLLFSPAPAASTSPNSTTFVDLNADGNADVAYSVDGTTTVGSTTGGLYKFSRSGSTWTAQGQLASLAGTNFVTGRLNGANVELYITTSAGLFLYTEAASAATTALTGALALGTALATPAASTVFRGVAFAPVSALPVNTALSIANGTFSSTAALANSNSTNFTLSNSGATAQTVTLTTSGAPFSYAGSAVTVPAKVGFVDGTATFVVNFAPTAAGTFNGTVTAAVTGLQNVTSASFSGVGTAPANTALTITNGTFSSTASGSNSNSTNFTLSNSSATSQSVTIATGGAPFSYAGSTIVVPANGSNTFVVNFAPTAVNTFSGTVTAVVSGFQDVVSGSFSATSTAAVPTATNYSATSLLAGILSNELIAGNNLSGATVSITANTAGTITLGTVATSLTSVSFTIQASQAGSFNLNLTTAGGSVSQLINVTTPPAGFFEPFESGIKTGYGTGTVALTTGTWTLTEALLGNQAPTAGSLGTGEKKNNGQAARLRTLGSIAMNFDKNVGAGTISFLAAIYGTDAAQVSPASAVLVEISTNGGGLYSPVGSITPTATLSPYSFVSNTPGSIRLRFTSNSAGATPRIDIDDLQITDFGAVGDLLVSSAQNISGTYNNVTVTSAGIATVTGLLTVNTAMTVQSGGSLITAAQSINGAGSFTLASGTSMSITNTAGITATGAGATGAVQVTGIRSYSNDATYVYNGTVAQSSGAGLPATVRGLEVSNTNGLTLSQATAVAQALTLTTGSLATGGLLTLLSNATGTALVVNAGSGSVTGSTAVQRYINPSLNPGIGYRHFSSPVAAQFFTGLAAGSFTPVLNAFYNTSDDPYSASPFPNVFGYDEGRVNTVTNPIPDAFSKGWFVPTVATMTIGKGYSVNISAANKVTFNGTLNNGTLPVNLTRTGGTDGGWQLVGNPYPAPLNIAAIGLTDRSNLDAAFYIFRSVSQYNGFYDSYVNNIGTLVAASGQGFFCRVSAGQTAGTLTFRNAQRQTAATNSNPVFQRGAADARPLLRLTLASAAAPTAADAAYVYLQAGATAGFDTEFDAAKMANPSGLNLAVVAGTERLAISGLPLLAAATIVPLTVALPAVGSYVLTAADLANFGGTAVVLRDALTGTRTALTAGTAYRFTAAGTTANGRFTLELNPSAAPLATAAQALAALMQVYPNPAHGTFHLTLPASAKAATVQVMNALGQVVITRLLTSAEADFSTAKLAAGVYTLRLAVDGTAVARKLVVE